MRVDLLTIFPQMLRAPLAEGIVQRACAAGLVEIQVHDLREYTDDRHRTTDDAPFGGGPGMVMKAEPFFRAKDALFPTLSPQAAAVVLLSPRGKPFDQAVARRYAGLSRLVLLCGRYEGIDERVAQGVATEELSLGDFVLTGGEVAALAVVEATVRLIPGALGDEGSAREDSFSQGLLDWPHYTRPASLRGLEVPEVLLSGDHARIRRWRREQALLATLERREDLLSRATLGSEDEVILRQIHDRREALVPSGGRPAALIQQ
jgi:tRNA (guanine37-N1)-methyltransferase